VRGGIWFFEFVCFFFLFFFFLLSLRNQKRKKTFFSSSPAVTITLFYYFAELRKSRGPCPLRLSADKTHFPTLFYFRAENEFSFLFEEREKKEKKKELFCFFPPLRAAFFIHSLTCPPPTPPKKQNRNGSLLELNLPRAGLSCDLATPTALPALAAAAPELSALDLSGNDLMKTRVELIAPALGSLPSLESLDLSASGLRGDLGGACAMVAGSSKRSSKSKLRSANLAANEVGGALPPCLVSDTPSLQALHLDFNPLVGALPPKLGEGLVLFTAAAPAAENSNNNGDGDGDGDEAAAAARAGGGGARAGGLTGALPASLPSKMTHLDLSNNRIEGHLPEFLPEAMTQLHLSGNALSGELPPTLFGSSSSKLRSLRLGSNSFTGPLPDQWAASETLRVLDLSANALSGELPLNWTRAEYLSVLSLADNELEGVLPPTLASSRALVVLDVSGNRLSGGLADFANALPIRGERGEDDRGSLLKSFSIARNAGLDQGTLAAAAALSRLGTFAPPSLEPAVKVPDRSEAVANAEAAFARRKAVGLRGGGSSSGSGNSNNGGTLVPPALPGIQEPSDAEMIAASSPRLFDATGCAGLGGPFPSWLVTATAAASTAVAAARGEGVVSGLSARPTVDVRLSGVPLSCPPSGALFSVKEQPPRRAFEGLTCEAMPEASGSSKRESVPISSLLRIVGAGSGEKVKSKTAKASKAPAANSSSDSVEQGKARARATAVRVIGVVLSLATVTTALALCARSCCGSSHRSRSSNSRSGLGSRFSRWRSSSCGESGGGEGGPSGAISSSSSSDPSSSAAVASSSAVAAARTRPIHKSASASAVVVSACAASPLAGANASLFVGNSNSSGGNDDKI